MRAALLAVLLVACKGSSNHAIDASVTPDAPFSDAPDAPFDSNTCASCPPMTVTLYGEGGTFPQGQPIAGFDVYFIAPDQTFQKVQTGSDGKATAKTPDGTEVMIDFVFSSTQRYLDVYPDLRAGDSLVIGDPTLPTSPTNGATIYVDYPTFSDATIYSVMWSCGNGPNNSSALSQILGTSLPCPSYTAGGITVSATDSQGNLGYTSIANVDFSTQNGPNNHIVLPAFQAAGTITTSVTNLPAISTNDEVVTFYTLTNDPNDHANFGYTDLSNGSPGTTITNTGPTVPFGNFTHTIATFSISGFAGLRYDAVASQQLTNVAIDTSTMPHPVTGQSGKYNAGTQTVSWTESSTIGQPATIVTAGVNWTAGNGSVAMGWRVPGGTTALAVPTLPSALSAIAYNPNELVFGGIVVQTFIGKTFHDAELYNTAGAPTWLTGP